MFLSLCFYGLTSSIRRRYTNFCVCYTSSYEFVSVPALDLETFVLPSSSRNILSTIFVLRTFNTFIALEWSFCVIAGKPRYPFLLWLFFRFVYCKYLYIFLFVSSIKLLLLCRNSTSVASIQIKKAEKTRLQILCERIREVTHRVASYDRTINLGNKGKEVIKIPWRQFLIMNVVILIIQMFVIL